MEKEKRSQLKPSILHVLNWVFVTAIVVLTAHLVMDRLFATTSPVSQSVAGTWTGIITDDYDEFIIYDFTINFDANDDGTFSGETFAQSEQEFRDVHAGTKIHAHMDDADTLSYYDTEIHGANTGWCKIKATLKRTRHNGIETLAGKWHGLNSSGCTGTSGRIHLIKES